MKTITIKEPWATLIVEGYKEYEFRVWKTNYRGEVLIHAGKSYDEDNLNRFKHLNLKYSPGKIIAKAKITDCVLVDESFSKKMLEKDEIVYSNLKRKRDKKLYGFKMENIEKIDPIEVNGKLSLWEYDYK